MRISVMIVTSAVMAVGLLAGDRVTLAGKVLDSADRALEHVTVLVYHAGVKRGYSTFCPSCYADCGKKAITGSDGSFVIKNVDGQLWFELLAVRDGFRPVFIKKVDPLSESKPNAVLLPRVTVNSPAKVVRGRVVDDHGLPLRDSVIQPIGVSSHGFPDGTPAKGEVSMYGTIEGLEPIAVTNEKGEFEIAGQNPVLAMLVKIEARGFAPKVQALSTGIDRKTITVSPGAVVQGRLLHQGSPVAGAQIGLMPRNRGGFGAKLTVIGDPYEEIRVGTQADGSFVLANVPTPVDWYVYAKMESLSNRLAVRPVECATKHGGEVTNVRELKLEAGHRLDGKIVLADGKSIPDGMRVIISSTSAWDSQIVPIHSDGGFECNGLPTGSYDISPAVRGYRPSEAVRKMPIDHDIDDFRSVLEPESRR